LYYNSIEDDMFINLVEGKKNYRTLSDHLVKSFFIINKVSYKNIFLKK